MFATLGLYWKTWWKNGVFIISLIVATAGCEVVVGGCQRGNGR